MNCPTYLYCLSGRPWDVAPLSNHASVVVFAFWCLVVAWLVLKAVRMREDMQREEG